MSDEEKQVKSKKRVRDHGEVFTAEREVKAMCDLVDDELRRIESRVLEPTCGTGNFLVEILNRKLEVVTSRYAHNIHDWEKFSFLAVSSLYGVEFLRDNAITCRVRLYEIWDKAHAKINGSKVDCECYPAISFLLGRNIICGDTLAMSKHDGSHIIFSEWNFETGDFVKRRDFKFMDMLPKEEKPKKGKKKDYSTIEEQTIVAEVIPEPIQEYAPVEYWRIQEQV